MSMNSLSALKLAAAACMGLSSSVAFAAQITVTDCSGTPRLIKQVADNEMQTIRLVTVSTGSQVGEFRLSLQDVSGSVKNVTVNGSGTVTFREVSPGTWKVCGLPDDVLIEDVSLVSTSEVNTLQVASLVGAGGLIGGGLLLGSSNGRADDELAAPLEAIVNTEQTELEMVAGGPSQLGTSSESELSKSDEKRPFTHSEDCLISGAEGCLTGTDITSPISPFR